MFEPLSHPLVFDRPRRLTDVASWHEHVPFAFFAVAALRPRLLVELGTHKGDSYCAFCQAVLTLGLGTRCYAVDTWRGDVHSGEYGPEVLEELRAYHDPLYGSFSSLLPQTFDEAAGRFADGSIDLLHIDGCHTYEAVAHDVETWLPKLSERGVVLMHDTSVREGDFGVWRLWDELSELYRGFAFAHGHGLGVLAVGGEVDPAFAAFLESARREPLAGVFFAALGSRIGALGAAETAAARLREIEVEAEDARRGAELAVEREAAAADEARARADALRAELERLERQVREREADLEQVTRSASWRLTAPLRTAKHDVRKARRAVRRVRRPAAPAARGPSPQRAAAPPLTVRPLVSVVTPVYDTDPRWLARAVESVRRQTYPHWQLVLATTARPTRARSRTSRASPATPRSTSSTPRRTAASPRRRTSRSAPRAVSSSRFSTTTTSSTRTRCSSASAG